MAGGQCILEEIGPFSGTGVPGMGIDYAFDCRQQAGNPQGASDAEDCGFL